MKVSLDGLKNILTIILEISRGRQGESPGFFRKFQDFLLKIPFSDSFLDKNVCQWNYFTT